jgi:fatty-acyl-CoA synthase
VNDESGQETELSYAEVTRRARSRGQALLAEGLKPGCRIGLIVVDIVEFITTFYGAISVGIVPVPMFPPLSLGKLDGYMDKAARILQVAEASGVVTERKLALLLWGLVGRVPSLRWVKSFESIRHKDRPTTDAMATPAEDDVAFLQFTSGSTSYPKGVVVTHQMAVQNVLATCRDVIGLDPETDVGVSWLPLFHDMGLSCATVGLIMTNRVVLIPTLSFARKPNTWLDAIHRHRGTITYAPNFAYSLARRRAQPSQLKTWDLSSVRVMGCGAEPIMASTLREFQETFGPCGLKPSVFQPCYGLAEATLAVTMVPMEDSLRVDRIDRSAFENEGIARSATEDGDFIEFVDCGPVLPGHQLVIRNEAGEPVPDRVKGEITVRGPCVMSGYFRDADGSRAILRGGWLYTGDAGYLADSRLYVTGRFKDLIIVRGRNVHPETIEWTVAEVDGIRSGGVIAFARPGPDTEEPVVAAETSVEELGLRTDLQDRVRRHVRAECGLAIAEVVLVPVGSLPKTSSGKLQRAQARQLYLEGRLGEGDRRLGRRASGIALGKHVLRGIVERIRTVVRRRSGLAE